VSRACVCVCVMNHSIDSRVVLHSCQRSEILRRPAPGYLLDGAVGAGAAGAAGAADGANFGADPFLRLQGLAGHAGQLNRPQLPLVLAGLGENFFFLFRFCLCCLCSVRVCRSR
jgi:hypothetical protein